MLPGLNELAGYEVRRCGRGGGGFHQREASGSNLLRFPRQQLLPFLYQRLTPPGQPVDSFLRQPSVQIFIWRCRGRTPTPFVRQAR